MRRRQAGGPVKTPTTAPVAPGRPTPAAWAMLVARLALFAAWQCAAALVLWGLDTEHPWQASVAWWPVSGILANLTNLALLRHLARLEGLTLRDIYRLGSTTWKADLGWTLAVVVITVPLTLFPMSMLGTALWGSAETANAILLQKLPVWAAVLAFAFPVTIALTELPTYYGYVMPRLQAATGSRWGVLLLVAWFGAAQHITMPLVADGRFMAWRLLMFLPFSLFWAWSLDRRPSLLPLLMGVHVLLDVSIPVMLLLAALDIPLA